ncbi:hypothetical protein GUY44_24295 [Pimelobacter simplex]|uniref:hypothetical protein n=1 Tax=Nocardioides simplex TaxID=2045 RepID=UPI0005D82A1F|nr:hypothetical protein [Pimelobacter simplex]MCG8153619.1 hypothetical protein [Pimelobacter simplex]GEB17092.1 hypothetical protein NSI01_54070 [Pimelobacter simplex]SFN07916.1 hypothetical protein SAMN05421671_4978 [Pimelobacter simplex]
MDTADESRRLFCHWCGRVTEQVDKGQDKVTVSGEELSWWSCTACGFDNLR